MFKNLIEKSKKNKNFKKSIVRIFFNVHVSFLREDCL